MSDEMSGVGASEPLPFEIVVQLSRPLQLVTGEEVSELTIPEPTLGTLRKMGDRAGMDATAYLLECAVGLPSKTLDTLPARDFNALAEALQRFLEAGKPPGAAPSPT